ncbi:MAG: hypothetical protein JO288_00810 [Hyphomicrobiales bacterium]|nr:hypothetical protein [Hyphomicrobiales bacterium]
MFSRHLSVKQPEGQRLSELNGMVTVKGVEEAGERYRKAADGGSRW